MDVRLLGPLEVRLGDGPIQLGPRKQRAVLAMLALEVGRTVSADRLAAGLWGEEPPPSAPKMVQLYVSHLRRVLDGDASIATRGRGYELQLPEAAVDALRFEQLLEESRGREALALWRGDALADVADEPFAAAEIRRLDELRLQAAEMAIDADLEAGRHVDVIGELEGLVAAAPLREHLHAQRMLALYRAGRQSEALAAYREARAGLVEQIGVEPGAELQRLHEQILAHDASLDLPPAAGPESRAPPQRRSRALLVGAAALVLAGVLAFGIIRVLEPEGLSGIDEDAVGLIDPNGGRITEQYSVGHSPGAVTSGNGSVWVANRLDGTVSRIDRDRQLVTIDVGGAPSALAFGAGSLWVADGDSRFVAQVDPGSNKVSQRIDAANAPRSLALAEGALWAVGAEGDVYRVDLGRPSSARRIPIGVKATAIVAGAGALWVASEEAGFVTRLDPRSGRVVESISVGHAPSALAVGEGAVWVVDRYDGTLARIDPAKNSVAWSLGVGHDPTAVAVGEGAVWVAGGEDATVARVDPKGPRKAQRFKTGSSPSALAVAEGSVWTAAVAPASAHRGGTLRADVPLTGVPFPANWLHTDGYFPYTWMVAGLAYDGLVAYRRVPGVAGATLVGGLATRPPAPSPDGRTYVFTLRRGIRYSDGTPVRPSDFRASMERYLHVSRDNGFPPYFARIVGAPRCISEPARCDLSRGIESDEHTRTITIHLSARDPELLHKLTTPFAYVVPSGTPAHEDETAFVAPGTGPYRIARWDERRGGLLVRNPHFRPTTTRPAGFPDRIDVKVTPLGRLDTHVAAIDRGSADVTWLPDLPLRGRLADLVAHAPGRFYSNPMPGAWWMFLNVRRPPFDDIRVREALNLAADRAKLVELYGGPQLAAPICQLVPPAFPGFSPYCPYTVDPSRGGGWTAPNLERARRLVAASGQRGANVTVDVGTDVFHAPGPYFVSLLRALGFHARLRVTPSAEYFERIGRHSSRLQIGVNGWLADYLSPSIMLDPVFACSARGDPRVENASQICAAGLHAAIGRARAADPEDTPAAWAAVDRRVVRLAAVVPYVRSRLPVFVSKRVGNVTYHPTYSTLLDQMWVR
jgi:peptide/nickel transport system substrate-binding protein